MSIKIKKYNEAWQEKLINLLGFMWKSSNEKEREEKFFWRYINNPYTKEPVIFIAEKDGELAGFRAFVIQKAVLDSEEYQIFSPADAIVHPSYRRMGVFSKLNDFFLEDICAENAKKSVILNLSSNKYSTPGYLKQGWQKSNGLKSYGFKISLYNFLKAKLKNINVFDYTKDKGFILVNKLGQFEISSILYADEMAEFVSDNRQKSKITNIRDIDYFKWRYSNNKHKYRFVYLRSKGELKGYCVIKKSSSLQYSLEEYMAVDTKHLHNIFKKTASVLNIPVFRTMIISNHQKKILNKCGFYKEPALLLKLLKINRLPVLVRPVSLKPQEADFFINGLDIRNMENWLIYQADVH